jgi:subtilisin family serine protease
VVIVLVGNQYGLESGTSMATPHVTGFVALYKAGNPLATPSEIRTALLQTAASSNTSCNGGNYGYFFDDVDNFNEPLLYINLENTKTN